MEDAAREEEEEREGAAGSASCLHLFFSQHFQLSSSAAAAWRGEIKAGDAGEQRRSSRFGSGSLWRGGFCPSASL